MKISIVLTAYNVEKYIGEAIESCLNQTYKDLEIIIVEDCSIDNTKEIIKTYLSNSNIKLIENNQNRGAGLARRIGIQHTTGEYILILDGDDWIDNNFIEVLVNKAIETDADIVSGGMTVRREDGSYDATSYGNCICETPEDKVIKFWKDRIVFLNNKLIRKKLHNQIPYCHRRFIEDTPVIIPQLYLANKVVYVDHTGYNYRMLDSSLTHKASPFKYALYRCLCAQDIIKFFEKHDLEFMKQIPIVKQYAQHIEQIKKLKPTPAMIEEFKEDWIEFSCRLLSGE